MNNEEMIHFIFYSIDFFIKFLFILCSIFRIIKIKSKGIYQKRNGQWGNLFFSKLLLNFFLSIYNGSQALVLITNNPTPFIQIFQNYKYCLISLYSFDSITWFMAALLLFSEYNRHLPQSWLSLRLLWFLNGLKDIAQLIFGIIRCIQTNTFLRFMVPFLIQNFFSFFLLYFSLFASYDYIVVDQILETNLISKDIIESDTEDVEIKGDLSEVKYSIEIKITEASIDEQNLNASKKSASINDERVSKINEEVLINFSIKIKSNTKQKKQNYNKTKTINSLVLFNEELKEKLKEMYEQKEKKNKNDSFIQSLIKQAYSTSYQIKSIIGQDKNDSHSTESSISIPAIFHTLELIYVKLSKLSPSFLIELLKFLEINNKQIFYSLANKIESMNNNKFDHRNELGSLSSFKVDNMGEEGSADNGSNNNNNNYLKMEQFVNDMLGYIEYIKIIIESYDQDKEAFICLYKVEKYVNTIPFEISLETLDEYLEQEKEKFPIDILTSTRTGKNTIITEIASLLQDQTSMEKIINLLEVKFTKLVNDLFYYDENLFSLFSLNKIIKLDIETFDRNPLVNFFAEPAKVQSNSKYIEYPVKETDYRYYSFECDFEKVLSNINDTDKERLIYSNIVILYNIRASGPNNKIYGWNAEIDLQNFYFVISEMLDNRRVKLYYSSLSVLLKQIKNQIETILNSYNISIVPKRSSLKFFNASHSKVKENSTMRNIGGDSERKQYFFLFDESIKKLFTKPYQTIFYSTDCRKIFNFREMNHDAHDSFAPKSSYMSELLI